MERVKTKLPSKFLFAAGEIQEAREEYLERHHLFFGTDGVAANLDGEIPDEGVKAAWMRAFTPPEFVADSWTLLIIWACWSMWSEYTLPMFLAVVFLSLYATGWFYFECISPLLRHLLG